MRQITTNDLTAQLGPELEGEGAGWAPPPLQQKAVNFFYTWIGLTLAYHAMYNIWWKTNTLLGLIEICESRKISLPLFHSPPSDTKKS